jgi:hypothetical protein
MREEPCDHLWGDGEDWEFDGETEHHVIISECQHCGRRLTPELANEQLSTLRADLARVEAERDALAQALTQIATMEPWCGAYGGQQTIDSCDTMIEIAQTALAVRS